MALATYLIRALPMTLIRGEIKNKFIKSFLHYVPYATISALIFPDSIFCASDPGNATVVSIVAALIGLFVAFFLSYKEKDLVFVSLMSCIAVFIAEKVLSFESIIH